MTTTQTAVGWLLATLFISPVWAYMGPATISPENPRADDVIRVHIAGGICDFLTSDPRYPQYPELTQDGNALRFVAFGAHLETMDWCIAPEGVGTYIIGRFIPGVYTLQVAWVHEAWWPPHLVTEDISVIPFTVRGAMAPAIPAPTLDVPTLGLLALSVSILGIRAFRRSNCVVARCAAAISPEHPHKGFAPCRRYRLRSFSIFLLTLLSLAAHAEDDEQRYLRVLLSHTYGAPTPDEVVDYFRGDPRPPEPPLQGLAVGNPKFAVYLVPVRAEGEFLEFLRARPETARARLERYVIIVYASADDARLGLDALQLDPYVDAVSLPHQFHFSSAQLTHFSVSASSPATDPGTYGWNDLNINAAWQATGGGYAVVGVVDSGLRTSHPALRQFDASGHYVGGNFMPVASLDVGSTTQYMPPNNTDPDVDEAQPAPMPNPACNPSNLATVPPSFAGHGTHVSGLIAANGNNGSGLKGTCKKCGLAAWKTTYALCEQPTGAIVSPTNQNGVSGAIALLGDIGAQVVNISFGEDKLNLDYCATASGQNDPDCLAIAHAALRDIALVAASGNWRTYLDFPASDSRVIAVGGFQQNLALWDDAPGSQIGCPLPLGGECGSNFTVPVTAARQELLGSAKSVLSTTYPGYNWNPLLHCGDSFPGPGWGQGIGWCTGTSMSAPQIAGIVGLLRSINPLVPVGRPTFNPVHDPVPTLRYVLASTTFEAQANQAWSSARGYGRPDAGAAARTMLGQVAGVTVRNRVTPLFRLYANGTKDYAETTSPQSAVALMLSGKTSWQPATNAPLVPGYSQFPHDSADGVLAAPRAAIYVLTTDVKPRAEWPDLIPLHLMDRTVAGQPNRRDFVLMTTTPHIEQAHAAGYELRTIQGYIYKPCAPEPQCIPSSAQKLWRACKLADDDCATFLETERALFEANGYTVAFPNGSTQLLGYAYPATDTDHDSLPDGFEHVVGTNPSSANSDNDTQPDMTEFPMIGVARSDPCGGVGSSGALYCEANLLFKNGFDGV